MLENLAVVSTECFSLHQAMVAKWLKRWTADLQVPGFGPTFNRDYFSSGYVHSALTQKLRRRVTFMSFGGDIK